jgi:RNA polymerase sigma-70 factor (ECF subfamily)
MTSRSDQELVEDFQRGNESSFNELILRYQERLYWVARRFVQDHDNADDVVQDVFCRAYEGLGKFRGESGIYTWLYRITVNLALNAVRRQKVREFFRIDEILDVKDEHGEQPDEHLEKKEQKQLIEQAVAQLPEKQKAVFILRYYDEMPYEEIAKIMKTTVGGLKANYFHAVRKVGAYVKRAHRTR